MGSEHTIYLTSLGSLEIYPENTACKFINRLGQPIVLPDDVEYEVGLVSILYPTRHDAIVAHDNIFKITFTTIFNTGKGEGGKHTFRYNPNVSIPAGNMKRLVDALNSDMTDELRVYFGDNLTHYVKDGRIFRWNETHQRIELQYVKGESLKAGEVTKIGITFSQRAGYILGFRGDTMYEIYGSQQMKDGGILSYSFPSENCGVDYIYVYSDIIQPSPFAGKLVNILDCFHVDNGRSKGIHNTLYKPLKARIIDQISIVIKDQNGRRINFSENSSVTCVLHARPK